MSTISQFRLTANAARELKIIKLEEPVIVTTLYDDWCIDVRRILRKKIFIFIHVKTRLALAIAGSKIGKTQNLFDCFFLFIQEYLYELEGGQSSNILSCHLEYMRLTKTYDKSTLKSLVDFNILLGQVAKRHGDIDQFLCDKVVNISNNMPRKSFSYRTPNEIWKESRKLNLTCDAIVYN